MAAPAVGPAPAPPARPVAPNPWAEEMVSPPESRVLDEVQERSYAIHGNDLKLMREMQKEGSTHGTALEWARESSLFALFRSFWLTNAQIVSALMANPTALISDPIGFIYGAGFYTLTFTLLSIMQVVLFVFFALRGDLIIRGIQNSCKTGKWPDKLSVVNWACPEMLRSKGSINRAREVLGAEMHRPHPPSGQEELQEALDEMDAKRKKCFDVDVARALLMMSAVLYEREGIWVKRAADYPDWSTQLLQKSEQTILEASDLWKIRYTTASDCVSIGGAFVGIFYSAKDAPEDPWMVVAFKGTSPESMKEWLIDATFTHTVCADYLWAGSCHEGFYSTLFPANGTRLPVSPFRRIQKTVNAVAHLLRSEQEARGRPKKAVNVWVTGHSLGSGLCSLYYARVLAEQTAREKNKQLNQSHSIGHIVLRDCYAFGTPNVGSGAFAGGFENYMSNPVNDERSFWRISNALDVVAKIPPGLADIRANRINLKESSLLNFAHLGIGIQLNPRAYHAPFAQIQRISMQPGTTVLMVEDHQGRAIDTAAFFGYKRTWWHPIKFLTSLGAFFVPFLADHAPTSYWLSLAKVNGDNRLTPHDDVMWDHVKEQAEEKAELENEAKAAFAGVANKAKKFKAKTDQAATNLGAQAQGDV